MNRKRYYIRSAFWTRPYPYLLVSNTSDDDRGSVVGSDTSKGNDASDTDANCRKAYYNRSAFWTRPFPYLLVSNASDDDHGSVGGNYDGNDLKYGSEDEDIFGVHANMPATGDDAGDTDANCNISHTSDDDHGSVGGSDEGHDVDIMEYGGGDEDIFGVHATMPTTGDDAGDTDANCSKRRRVAVAVKATAAAAVSSSSSSSSSTSSSSSSSSSSSTVPAAVANAVKGYRRTMPNLQRPRSGNEDHIQLQIKAFADGINNTRGVIQGRPKKWLFVYNTVKVNFYGDLLNSLRQSAAQQLSWAGEGCFVAPQQWCGVSTFLSFRPFDPLTSFRLFDPLTFSY